MRLILIVTASNAITGTIPALVNSQKLNSTDDCESFPSPFERIGLKWILKQEPSSEAMGDLTSFAICKINLFIHVPSYSFSTLWTIDAILFFLNFSSNFICMACVFHSGQ